ncbi:MAG: RHS repeat-associated core domain-containing protein, partial [Mediterranea massiliensis]|nr:RHS repeat-associated core domain-containing protein [Mediterranea massiliensis]
TNTYYYYLKDHQGNNRVVISTDGTVQETNHYYPFGGLFSTSTNVQPYKYNGKELDTKKGLNLYDYGARHYDAALGRWHVVDPLAEKYGALSPYGYCFNNPIKFVDKEGEVPFIVPFLVKGLIGAAIDATTQVSISMLSGNSFTAAVGSIDMVSVGKSFVTSAVPMGKVAKLGFEVADAAVDIKANGKIENVVTETKDISHAFFDFAASKASDIIADGFTNGLSRAISDDLGAKSAATMTKETKESLKHTKEVVNSEGFQNTASAITGFATGSVNEITKEYINDSLLYDELKNN